MFVAPGSVAVTAGDASVAHLVLIAAVFAGIVAFVAFMIGRSTGAYINPAVTAAAAVRGDLPARDAAAYVGAQFAGGAAAGGALALFFAAGPSSANLGATALAPGVSAPWGAALEVAGTFALALAALNAGRLAGDRRAQIAVVAAVLFVTIAVLGPLTGASLNPARSLGPALGSGAFDDLGLYLTAPTLGAVLAGALSRPRPPAKRAPAP